MNNLINMPQTENATAGATQQQLQNESTREPCSMQQVDVYVRGSGIETHNVPAFLAFSYLQMPPEVRAEVHSTVTRNRDNEDFVPEDSEEEL